MAKFIHSSSAEKENIKQCIKQAKGIEKFHDEDLIKFFFFTAKQMRIFVTKNLKDLDIGFEQAGILFLLKSQGVLGVNKIASLFEKDKATISRTIKALENKKLIEREISLIDKRSNEIKLSKLGYAKMKEIEEQKQNLIKKIKNAISIEERQVFISTLQKLLKVTQ